MLAIEPNRAFDSTCPGSEADVAAYRHLFRQIKNGDLQLGMRERCGVVVEDGAHARCEMPDTPSSAAHRPVIFCPRVLSTCLLVFEHFGVRWSCEKIRIRLEGALVVADPEMTRKTKAQTEGLTQTHQFESLKQKDDLLTTVAVDALPRPGTKSSMPGKHKKIKKSSLKDLGLMYSSGNECFLWLK